MKREKTSLIASLLFIIVGMIIFVKPDIVVKFTSYLCGGVFILVGIYKCINYYVKDKNLKVVNYYELAFGITAIVLGLLFILLASTIELLIRIFIGLYLILRGINYIMQTFYTTTRDKKFIALIVMGLIFIGIGLYIVIERNLVLSIVGLFMALYGLIDFISYFVYKDKENIDEKNDNNNKEVRTIKNKEVVEEVEFEQVKEKKKKGKK